MKELGRFWYYSGSIFWTLFVFFSTSISILAWSIYDMKGFIVGLFGMAFGSYWLFFGARIKPKKKGGKG